MAYTNYVVSGLTAYVEQSKDLIIKDVVLGGAFIKRIGIQTGIKKDAYLHLFDVAPVFGNGADCTFTGAGTATITERLINTANLNVQMEICPKNLIGKYAEYLVRNNATEHALPFEQYLVNGVVTEINNNIEYMLWQGDKTNQSSDPILKWLDGLIVIANEDLASGNKISIASSSSAYAGILAVYAALPEEVLAKGAEIYVSPAIFRAFMQEMVALNYYHYAATAEKEFILPGTDVKVVSVYGLKGNLNILGTTPSNLVYGCDLEGDNESVDLWFSQDDRVYKLEVVWNSGIQIAVPAWAVLGTFAAAPVAPAGLNASVATIATQVTGLNADTKVFKTKEQS